MRLLPAIIIAIAIMSASLIWVFVPRFLDSASAVVAPAVDSGARIEIEMMRGAFEDLQAATAALDQRITSLQRQIEDRQAAPLLDGQTATARSDGPNAILDAYAQVVQVADRRNLNQGLTVVSPRYLVERLGMPREVLSDDCEPMTNARLRDILVIEQVGPIRVSLLQPAIDSLRRIFETIESVDPDLYARIDTAGALCVRRIRGSMASVSSHSFGLAVDLNIDGQLDTLGDGRTQMGLTILADFFNAEGWIWGAAFTREDSMHFEVSQEKLDEWLDAGLFGG